MPVEIVMPRLSDTMDRGTVARWLKKEGEEVKKGEALAEIETDKATLPLESFYNGTVGRILLPEGGSAPIGEPIATLVRPGETEAGAASEGAEHANAPASSPPNARSSPENTAPPRAPAGTPARSTPASASGQHLIPSSPLARRIAEELGIDLASVKGTGPNGRVTREDVEEAARERQSSTPTPSVPVSTAAPSETETSRAAAPIERPLTRMQETVARRMVQSKSTVPHFYVTIETDVAAVMALREQLNQTWSETRVGVEDLIVKALGIALTEFPIVNASWQTDRIVYHNAVNIGVAIAVENGLLVPVLHDVQTKGLRALSKEIKALRQRVRDGKAQAQDYQGGTFTVSNLGPYGVDEFLAIVNPPESGILALGGIERKPVVRGDEVVISQRMRLSLSADHRVFYGAVAAQFLSRVRDLLEKPLSLLA